MGLTKPRSGQINFDATNITDPLIRINSGQSQANDKDAGWVVERGSDANVALIWDESADEFVLANTTEDGTTSGNVTISSYAGMHVGSFIANGLTYPTSDGTNGQVLQTDGSGTLSFADGAKSNIILNGGFDIWQRGTSFTSTVVNEYSADRFRTEGYGHNTTISRQSFTFGQTDVPNYPTYFCRIASSSTVASGEYWGFQQRVERPQFMSGSGEYTLSFWVKSTAPVSAGAFTFGIASMTAESSPALTTSWQKVTATATIASSGSYVSIYIVRLGEGQGNFTVDIADVQLEIGSVANSFERRNVAEELALCQRYFEKSAPSTSSLIDTSQGYVNVRDGTASTTPRYYHTKYSVEKRATPTITLYDALGATGKVRADSTNDIAGVVYGGASTAFNLYANTSITHYGIFYGWYSDAEL